MKTNKTTKPATKTAKKPVKKTVKKAAKKLPPKKKVAPDPASAKIVNMLKNTLVTGAPVKKVETVPLKTPEVKLVCGMRNAADYRPACKLAPLVKKPIFTAACK